LVFKRKKQIDPLRETLRAIYGAKQGISRIEALMDKISSRRARMLEIAGQLEARGETYLARKYAEEISKLDKIYNRLADIRLFLEKISLSLEYAISYKSFREIASEVAVLLNDLKKIPEATVPEVNMVLTDLEYSIRNLEEMDYSIPEASEPVVSDTNEVNKIIEEAREIIKKKLETEISVDS